MAWSASGMFREWNSMVLQLSGTGYAGLTADTVKVALFNNSATPDKDAAVGSSGYNTGTWATANEVTGATIWTATGRALSSKTVTTPSSGVVMFDAADLAGGGTGSLTNAFGCLVYDDTITAGTVADQGICFNYFGGAQSVASGTFTIVWNSNGIARITST